MRRPWSTLTGIALLAAAATPAPGQTPPRITVPVRQVAGATLYFDAGSRHGLLTGDTIRVVAPETGEELGRLAVTAATAARSVLTHVATPFEVERGRRLTLVLLREPLEEPAGDPAPATRPTAGTAPGARPGSGAQEADLRKRPGAPGPSRRAHGRIAMDVDGSRSSTTVGEADVVRYFATPALRMDVRAPELIAGFTLRTSVHVSYRYTDQAALGSTTSAHVYAASLERRFTSVPLEMVLGRFHSPVERYSGFWDGAMVRAGGRDLGVGAIVGFEPDRWNEAPSGSRPKATVFVDARGGGRSWRWQGNASVHTVQPTDSLPTHTFVGVSQRFSAGPLLFSQDLQVDADPTGGAWKPSRFRARLALRLARGFEVRAGASRRETYHIEDIVSPFGSRRDRVDAGIGLRGSRASVSVDGGWGWDESGTPAAGATLFASLDPRGQRGGIGLTGSLSRWDGAGGATLTAAPGLRIRLDRINLRFGYRYSRSEMSTATYASHGVDGGLDVPLGAALRAGLRWRHMGGGALSRDGLFLTLYRIF